MSAAVKLGRLQAGRVSSSTSQAVLFSGRMMNARMRGDPGLFDILGKVVKGAVGAVSGFVTGGPLGAVAGGLKGAGIIKPQQTVLTSTAPMPVLFAPGAQPQSFLPMPTTPATAAGPGPGGCPAGFRMRTGIGAGGGIFTKCVKVRRMNPLNPQAASRAMRRLASAQRAVQFLSRFSIRSAKAAPRRRSSCSGCKSKRK